MTNLSFVVFSKQNVWLFTFLWEGCLVLLARIKFSPVYFFIQLEFLLRLVINILCQAQSVPYWVTERDILMAGATNME